MVQFSHLAPPNGAMQSRRGQGRYPRKYGHVVQPVPSSIQSPESESTLGARGLCEIRVNTCSGRLAQRGSRTIEGGVSSSIWNSTPECETEFEPPESDRDRLLICEEILGRRCESSPLHLFSVELYASLVETSCPGSKIALVRIQAAPPPLQPCPEWCNR